MKTLFFGTSEFAVPSLRVVAQRTQCAGAVTQPDRPAGRGQRLSPTPVKAAALELGLHVYEPQRLRAFAAEIAGERFDLFVLASYGRILPAELLALPRLGSLNVHPSLLPKYRGATPIQSAILHGERTTGVSIMLMDAGLDTGDVAIARAVDIEPEESYGELHDRLAATGAELLGEALDAARRGELQAQPQRGEATLTRPIGRDDLHVDWSWAPERIARTVRAYSPRPAARAEIDGSVVKLLRAHVADGKLVLDELVAPNRGRMSGEAYLRGRSGRS
ncbi:MAG TPA: methionyl-tRNA formyltransferase [Candidatus Cybelea sp.]|nr:methionyl-tRNA formyltransferase [Candidatus Cybelea sp.]